MKEGWDFLFNNTERIQAHHLVALLLTIAIIYLFSYIVAKIFKTLVKIIVLAALIWLLYMLLFDRSKYNELFSKNKKGKDGSSNNN